MSQRSAFFLRGINVGGRNRVPMSELRALAGRLGAGDIATHLASGNLVCTPPEAPAAFTVRLAAALEETYGFAVPVLARTAAELAAILAEDPFAGIADDPSSELVYLFAAPVAASARCELPLTGGEQAAWAAGHVRVWHDRGVHGSKVSHSLLEGRLGITVTARNVRTLAAVSALCGQAE
ncbi:DUF1697 domain-containing protein [Brevibacterium gallinarum]|uniref:DUF1697 domain-containing protein n=1 Tax=Brevibacterium gallinarum TaxID=2762220 RepID=A0ABR8WVT7_9MICO|nr:DUF1697 domain-containing protein [Brevibacterium gallinarum]MBD8021173.1 DUF1697 domain-containing protein [Brevibacterium gallinarum]